MCKKIGIGIKVRLPKNCDTCKYCDVFQGEYWQGYCSKLKRLVDIEYKTRDAECPIKGCTRARILSRERKNAVRV